MFRQLIVLALLAVVAAFAPSRFAIRGRSCLNAANCEDKYLDAKGRCPGETGYIPILKEAPADFAAFKKAQAAAKAAAVEGNGRCEKKYEDAKGRCPGETGYIPILKEAPTDFAAFKAAQQKK